MLGLMRLQLHQLGLQPLSPRVAASITHGCSLHHIGLQPLLHRVTASVTYGCSVGMIEYDLVKEAVVATHEPLHEVNKGNTAPQVNAP